MPYVIARASRSDDEQDVRRRRRKVIRKLDVVVMHVYVNLFALLCSSAPILNMSTAPKFYFRFGTLCVIRYRKPLCTCTSNFIRTS